MSNASATRLTAWVALIGGLFAYLNVALALMVSGMDTDMVYHGPTMLALSAEARDLFRWSMLADILGFYLPFLLIGAYLWRAFSEKAGVLGDAAAFAIVVYVLVGIGGAAMQQAALDPLAHLHAGGDDSVRSATEAAWTAVANASERGLWWVEGPLILFWAFVVGHQLKAAGWGQSLLLRIVGCAYGLFFLFGFFSDLDAIAGVFEIAAVLLFPLWMLLFGFQLVTMARFKRATQ